MTLQFLNWFVSPLICVLVWQCAPAAAQDAWLGRLFFTPEERQRLDQKRGTPAAASAPQTVIVNGVIIRPGMVPILFLDGKEVRQGEGPAGVSLAPQPNRSVRMQADGSPAVSVQPGQVVDLSSGRTFENYQLATPPSAAVSDEPLPTADAKGSGGKASTRFRSTPAVGINVDPAKSTTPR